MKSTYSRLARTMEVQGERGPLSESVDSDECRNITAFFTYSIQRHFLRLLSPAPPDSKIPPRVKASPSLRASRTELLHPCFPTHPLLQSPPSTFRLPLLPLGGGAMIHLLFTVLAAEAGVATALLFKTPLRKLAMLALDTLKRGRGPIMVRTVAATVLVVLASSVHSMAKIRGRASGELDGAGAGGLTPTDQILLARHLLEASLMGYALFLALVIDRFHSYIREIRGLKKNLEAVSKENKTLIEENKHLHDQKQSTNPTPSPSDAKKDS